MSATPDNELNAVYLEFNTHEWEYYSVTDPSESPPTQYLTDLLREEWRNSHVANAIGEFVQKMLDEGYVLTLDHYDVDLSLVHIRSGTVLGGGSWYHRYRSVPSVRLWFRTDPESITVESPIAISTSLIIAIAAFIIAIGVSAGLYNFLSGIGKSKEEYEKYGWTQNPDTGVWEWKLLEKGSKEGYDWQWIVGVVVVLIVGLFIITKYGGELSASRTGASYRGKKK